MNDLLELLCRVGGVSWNSDLYQKMVASAKAATDMTDEQKQDFIGFAEKVLKAEAARLADIAALMRKYFNSETIQPEAMGDD